MNNTQKPIIGITSSMKDSYIRMKRSYFDAVIDAGGIPVFLPFTGGADDAEKLTPLFDGILFAGGDDIDPKFYGEEIAFDNVIVNPQRDEFELAVARIANELRLPILGICRGEQVLNVAFGGGLYQHIEGHRQTEPGSQNLRSARITEGTLLHKLAGKSEIFTNTFHHQAVKTVAPGFVAAAVAEDGIVEAIEPVGQAESDRFFLAVQWHPELFYKTDETAKALFKAFIDAARK